MGTILFAKLLAIGSGPIIIRSIPLILMVLIYLHLHLDCNSFVTSLPKIDQNSQYIETIVKIIVAPQTDKLLYHKFDETKISSFDNFRCYVKENFLGPESIKRKINIKQKRTNLKSKRFIPLSQRTKTLRDLKTPINEVDEIDINNVNYKQDN